MLTPPLDQADKVRIGILFFTRPHDDVLLEPIESSPCLQRTGLVRNRESVIYSTLGFLEAKKHGCRNKDVDHDRPKDTSKHADPFHFNDDFEKAKKTAAVAVM